MPLDLSWADSHGFRIYHIGLGLHGLGSHGLGTHDLGSHDLGLSYLFSPFHYHLGTKIIFSVNNCPHIQYGPWAMFLCIKSFYM